MTGYYLVTQATLTWSRSSIVFYSIHTKAIVHLPLFCIGKYLIGILDFFELRGEKRGVGENEEKWKEERKKNDEGGSGEGEREGGGRSREGEREGV